MPGEAPILVNSAGCGAAMKDYGHLLGTPEAAAFSARVLDVHEWLAPALDRLPRRGRRGEPVIVQDPCHLRHVQRAHMPVRAVLGHVADVVELDDDGLCCGAGGAYSALQPELAGEIRERKVAAVDRAAARSGATIVASANPGCAMHLRRRRPRRPPSDRPRRRGAAVSDRYEHLADRLEAIVGELDEIAFDRLRLAAEEGRSTATRLRSRVDESAPRG